MHKKSIEKIKGLVFQFHLTKIIEPNLTFSDVLPTDSLVMALKTMIDGLSQQNSNTFKRQKSLERESKIDNSQKEQFEAENCNPKKAIKNNENQQANHIQFDQPTNHQNIL